MIGTVPSTAGTWRAEVLPHGAMLRAVSLTAATLVAWNQGRPCCDVEIPDARPRRQGAGGRAYRSRRQL